MLGFEADARYRQARSQGWKRQVWSKLTGRSHRLFSLAEINAAGTAHACHAAGIRTVPVNRIQGSEGRSDDFDRDFNPLHGHSHRRWLRIAMARQQGVTLPPVELIQVGEIYFVRDGHHRVSVARAFGQAAVEAQVTVWQASGPLPWEASRDANAGRLSQAARDGRAKLQKRPQLGLRHLLGAAGVRTSVERSPQVKAGSL